MQEHMHNHEHPTYFIFLEYLVIIFFVIQDECKLLRKCIECGHVKQFTAISPHVPLFRNLPLICKSIVFICFSMQDEVRKKVSALQSVRVYDASLLVLICLFVKLISLLTLKFCCSDFLIIWTQWLEAEILRLNHLREEGGKKGIRKVYPPSKIIDYYIFYAQGMNPPHL